MKKDRKGFTLAELLIVVAIIAVLVAISIPIFTTQLEKSREAVDIANVRSAYATLITSMQADSIPSVEEISVEGDIYYTVVPLQQKVNGWQSALPLNIAGVPSDNASHWIGDPKVSGACRIEYDSSKVDYTDALTLYWDAAHASGSPSGSGAPAPSTTPEGESSGPSKDPESDPAGTAGSTLPQTLIDGAADYPTYADTKRLRQGSLYNYNGTAYVVLNNVYLSASSSPTPETEGYKDIDFAVLAPDAAVYDAPGHYETGIKKGSLYVNGDDVYIRTTDDSSSWWDPLQDHDPRNWQLISR